MSKYLRNRLCIPVKGFNRSIIYDLTRKDYFFIPNQIFDIINSDNIILSEGIDNDIIEYLLGYEIIFEIKNDFELSLFPSISSDFFTPYDLLSLILDSDVNLCFLNDLDFQIENLTILVKKSEPNIKNIVINILELIEVESINVVFTDCFFYEDRFIKELESISEVLSILIFNTNVNYKINNHFTITTFENSFEHYAKNVYPHKFSVNNDFFFESKEHNPYFNKKLYINSKGEVRNGLFSKELGKTHEIINIFKSIEYNHLSHSKKEMTLVCSDCEFRRMCLDSRVPTYNQKNGSWFHHDECRYNPYISKWEDELDYKNLIACGIKLDEKLTLKFENLDDLKSYNNIIWGDE